MKKQLKFFASLRLLLTKVSYCRLEKNDIVILDENGSSFIRQMVLWDQKTTVLPCLLTSLQLNAAIFFNLVFNFHKALHIEAGFFKIYWNALYYVSVLKYLNPKVVISYIDNGSDFQLAGRLYTQPKWFFIQNGTRWPSLLQYPYLPKPPDRRSTIYLDNWFCFGASEADLLRRYGHIVNNAYPVGSLLASWYKSHLRTAENDKTFDICLISQQAPHIMNDKTNQFRFAVTRLESYIKRYVQENRLSLAVAMRSHEPEELKHYNELYGSSAQIFPNDRIAMSTFVAIDKSRVTLSVTSTAAYEAFGWGSKVLFCNFSGDPNYDTPIAGDWCLNVNSYELFSEKLTRLLEISEDNYLAETLEKRIYFMTCDAFKPAYQAIRDTVFQYV